MNNQYRQIMTDHFPDSLTISLGDLQLTYKKELYRIPGRPAASEPSGLRYGENPGQEAAVYRLVNGNINLAGLDYVGPRDALVSGLAEDGLLAGEKHPSKTNLTDVDAALGILRYLMTKPTAAIIKHNNPSGVARHSSLPEAFKLAYMADRVAAFGGAAVVNRPVDQDTAELMTSHYLEVVAAPDFEPGALDILLKKKDLRIFRIRNISRLADYAYLRFLDFKSLIDGGLIIQQSAQNAILSPKDFKPAQAPHQGRLHKASRPPTAEELDDLLFGWAVEQGVISNSALFVKNNVTVAIGGGQQDRVGVVEIAVFKAYQKYADALCFNLHGLGYQELQLAASQPGRPDLAAKLAAIDKETKEAKGGLKGSVMVSDAFFPFRDGVDVALKEGVTAIAHPGGALRDWEAIEAVNAAIPPAAMVFTGQRAFKH